jgi:hypothetical protein
MKKQHKFTFTTDELRQAMLDWNKDMLMEHRTRLVQHFSNYANNTHFEQFLNQLEEEGVIYFRNAHNATVSELATIVKEMPCVVLPLSLIQDYLEGSEETKSEVVIEIEFIGGPVQILGKDITGI